MISPIDDLPVSIARYEDQAVRTPSDALGRQDFLLLLTAQLQNQNPLEPVQNEAFVAQMAQFSQLEATLNMSESLGRLVESMNVDRVIGGASLVGKKVAAAGGQATLSPGGTVDGSVSLPTGADNLQIDVYSLVGELVSSMTLGRQSPGEAKFSWNGFNAEGAAMPPGAYRVEATAMAANQTAKLPVTTFALVKSVNLDPARESTLLELDGGRLVSLSDVRRISD